MKIGIEYEGVLLKNGKPIDYNSLDYTNIRYKIQKEYFGEYPCDGCSYLIEVRTKPHTNPEMLLNEFYFKKNRIEKILKKYGLKVNWTEMKIPKTLPQDKKENKTQFTFDENGKDYFVVKDNLYRGGGLHINFDSPTINGHLQTNFLFMMWLKVKYTDNLFKFKSQYRNKILFREHDFGYELMSVGWNFKGKRDKRFDELIIKCFK